MARPKSATHELKRDEILNHAASAFARLGFAVASMQDIAKACGTSKARLYHYYDSKEALLFDLLDRYTQRLLLLVGETEAQAQRLGLDEREALHELIRQFLGEYETSATRHVALLNDCKYLGVVQREVVMNRQRSVVLAFTRFLQRAYPERMQAPVGQAGPQASALTMLVMGMMNWTFTWLKPDGPLRYADFAELLVQTLESGFQAPQTKATAKP